MSFTHPADAATNPIIYDELQWISARRRVSEEERLMRVRDAFEALGDV